MSEKKTATEAAYPSSSTSEDGTWTMTINHHSHDPKSLGELIAESAHEIAGELRATNHLLTAILENIRKDN